MINVDEITKRFGAITALDGLSFKIDTGEVVGLLGPNGAGKSTAMRVLTGYLAPDSGSVTIDGIDVVADPVSAQRLIGYLPENNPLYRDMLVSEVLQMSAELKQVSSSARAQAYERVVDAVGLSEVYYRPVGQLSKGFRQRVGIATALVADPPILVLDEPTEGLDPGQRGDIRSLVMNLAKDRTIILSTHVMQEVQAVASRLMIVNRGSIVADGSVGEVTRAAQSGRTIEFEAQGSGVANAVKRLKGVKDISSDEAIKGRTKLTISTPENVDVRPELSRLARENEWTIWHLSEKEQRLEDVFLQLTANQGSSAQEQVDAVPSEDKD